MNGLLHPSYQRHEIKELLLEHEISYLISFNPEKFNDGLLLNQGLDPEAAITSRTTRLIYTFTFEDGLSSSTWSPKPVLGINKKESIGSEGTVVDEQINNYYSTLYAAVQEWYDDHRYPKQQYS
jgi:hypothetical protein